MEAPSRVCHILCLRLPGNVERIVNDVRSELYRTTAAASTQGLPAIIPLAYSAGDPTQTVVDSLPQRELQPLPVGAIGEQSGTLVIRVEMSDGWLEWLNAVPIVAPPPGMPVPLAGVFLGGPDLVGQEAARLRPDDWVPAGTVMPQKLTVLHMELVQLETREADSWWSHLDWKVLWSRRIKLRG